MSRTRRKPDADAVFESVPTETDEDPSVLPSRDDADIEGAIQALGKGAECKIYRRTPTGRQYLGRPPAAGISEESIRSDYGGGKFEIRFFDSMGKYRRQVTIDIEGPPKIVGQRESSVVVAPPPSPDPSVTAEIRLLKAEMVMQQTSHQSDRKLLLDMLGKLLPGPAPKLLQPAPALPVADLPALLQMLRDFLPTREPKPSANLDEVMKIFQLGLQQAEAGGGGDGGQDWSSLITKYAPQVLEFLGKMSASAVPSSAPAASPASSPSVMEPAAAVAVESEVVDTSPGGRGSASAPAPAHARSKCFNGQLSVEHEKFVRDRILPEIKARAQANFDVDLAADWIVANAQSAEYGFLIQLIQFPSAEFFQFDPELGSPICKGWFCDLHAALGERLGLVEPTPRETASSDTVGAEILAEDSRVEPASAPPGPDPAGLD